MAPTTNVTYVPTLWLANALQSLLDDTPIPIYIPPIRAGGHEPSNATKESKATGKTGAAADKTGDGSSASFNMSLNQPAPKLKFSPTRNDHSAASILADHSWLSWKPDPAHAPRMSKRDSHDSDPSITHEVSTSEDTFAAEPAFDSRHRSTGEHQEQQELDPVVQSLLNLPDLPNWSTRDGRPDVEQIKAASAKLYKPENEAPSSTMPKNLIDVANDHDVVQLVYGLARAFKHVPSARDDFRSFSFSTDPPPSEVQQQDTPSPSRRDVLPGAGGWPLAAMIYDDLPQGSAQLEDWFSQFRTIKPAPLKKMIPFYAQSHEISMVPEKKQDEEKKQDKKKTWDVSPHFACILLTNGKPLVPYPEDTLSNVGNFASSTFSTTIKVHDRLFTQRQLEIDVNVCFGMNKVQVAFVSIPLNRILKSPRTSTLNKDQLQSFFDINSMKASPDNGAFLLDLVLDNQDTTIQFLKCALDELRALAMHTLGAISNHIESMFTSKYLQLTIMVTTEWKDFEDWSDRFTDYFADSEVDPLAELKAKAKGQHITIRNYLVTLPEDARKLPAQMKFRNVDEMLTRLGDGAAREHAYDRWSAKELAQLECRALMMPIGTQKCIIKRDGKKVEVPYLYSFSVRQTSNDALFARLAPAINVSTKIQVQIDFSEVEAPMDNKTAKELVEMIGDAMHKQLWSHHCSTRTDKDKINQAWADDYAAIIQPYIKTEKFEGDDKLVHAFAYLLSLRLQKIRKDKDAGIDKGETPKEHRIRTLEQVNRYRNHLKLPADTTADFPQFTAARMSHDDPLDKLSDFQFVAYRPKQMGWPKKDLGLAPAPFLDFKDPRLPKHNNLEHLAQIFSTVNRKRDEKYLVPIKFVVVDDDVTANSKVQGLIKMMEFQNTPRVEWFTTFKGNPITTDVTQIFSVLRQVMHDYYYDPALPFRQSDDVQPEQLFYPHTLRDDKNHVIAITTPEFQRREAIVVQRVREAMYMFSEDQLQAFKMLVKAAYGTLIIEGVPGSGKTTLAHTILLACMYSSIRSKLQTVRQPSASKIEDSDDFDSDSAQDDKRYNIKPVIAASSQEKPKDKAESDRFVDVYDIPRLACGPTEAQFEYICNTISSNTNDYKSYCVTLFEEIRDVYYRNFERIRPIVMPKEVTDRVRDRHWQAWFSSVQAAMTHEGEARVDLTPEVEKGESAATTTDLRGDADEEDKPALPEDLSCNCQVMIIANQNVNGDDSARLMDKLLNEDLQFDELIVRVTNLKLESEALETSFFPERDEGIRHAPDTSDLVHLGIQGDKLHAFATRTGDFSTTRHGGVWKLENIMRRKLNDGENPSLLRDLTRLSDPADVFTDEERLALNNSIDDFMRDILKQAKVVICTFVVAQSLVHKALFKPTVVLIDEASRESELHIRWAQTALTTHLIMLTGDFRQDEPFVGGRYASEKEHKNIHMNQILTPLSRRVMTERPDCVVFLSENRRQHGDLHEISSETFYEGEMRTVYDTRYPTRLASVWHTFAQQFVRDMRALNSDKDPNDDVVAEYLHGNRVSLLCSSSTTKRGLSSVNVVHARLAVEIAARIHQSHIPGSDKLTRPRICIITPYGAQVDETKNQLRTLSSKEICHGLVEVRTQTSSTGGEWDVVILCLVQDSNMGFLSETNRLNVMWTRARYLSIDIFDEYFYRRPQGRGSKVIDRYRDTQALNRGQCKDPRNWYQVCRRCYTPHEKECRGTLKCFFCEKTGHHARNCTAPGSLDPTINPNVMDFPTV